MNIEHVGEMIVLRPQGQELGAEVAETFKAEGLAAMPPQGGQVVLDLRGIEFMDSSGLSAMVAMLKKARAGEGLILMGVKPAVTEILRLTRLDSVFPVCDTLEDAAAHFSEPKRKVAGG